MQLIKNFTLTIDIYFNFFNFFVHNCEFKQKQVNLTMYIKYENKKCELCTLY